MERKIEFLIEHHARFAVDIDLLKESIGSLRDRQVGTGKDIEVLVGLMARLEKAQERTDGQVATLPEVAKGTEDRLNGFIVFVEKYIASRNGGKEP